MLNKTKRTIKLCLRCLKDTISGHRAKFCKKQREQTFAYKLDFYQDIKPSETFANKVYNLQKAGKLIGEYTIQQGEIFSFWHIIGNPEYHFKTSRSIIKGKIINEVGGGICQVSGLMYFAAIKTKLEILERYNHSLDLYTEETRFAPLGSDATVVYGYKDLRFRNPYDFAIKFEIATVNNDTQLHLKLLSEKPIAEQEIMLEKQTFNNGCEIKVRYTDGTLINHSYYGYPTKDK